VKLLDVFPEILAALELDPAGGALEALLVGVHHHVIAQLVLVAQDFAADLGPMLRFFKILSPEE
jgi:hypothetical protein